MHYFCDQSYYYLLKFLLHAEPPNLLPLDFGADHFLEGDYAQASCVLLKGDQPLTLAWQFNGSALYADSDGVAIDTVGRSSILTLDPVKARHQGKYACVATNAAGSDTSIALLTVNGLVTI